MSYLVQAWDADSETYSHHYIKAGSETLAYQRAFRLCKHLGIEFNQLTLKITLDPYTKFWS